MRASIVIRTLNEAEHLEDLLTMVARQRCDGLEHEVVVVDSGSTDGTLAIGVPLTLPLFHQTLRRLRFELR